MENTYLSDSARARAYLTSADFHFSRALGQNFLLDDGWNARIAELSGAEKGDRVLEIGPGAGTLTCALLRTGADVLAVEIDTALRDVLEKMLSPFPNARVLYADIKKCDIPAIMAESFGEGAYKVVSNLPYSVAAELLPKLAGLSRAPESITVMVQSEAADRILSQPGDKNWCQLAARMQYSYAIERIASLPPSAFTPNAHVESALLRFDRYEDADSRPAKPIDEALFLRLVAAAFAMRRKTLANNIAQAFPVSREKAVEAILACGLSASIRGEALTLSQLAAVSNALTQ